MINNNIIRLCNFKFYLGRYINIPNLNVFMFFSSIMYNYVFFLLLTDFIFKICGHVDWETCSKRTIKITDIFTKHSGARCDGDYFYKYFRKLYLKNHRNKVVVRTISTIYQLYTLQAIGIGYIIHNDTKGVEHHHIIIISYYRIYNITNREEKGDIIHVK